MTAASNACQLNPNIGNILVFNGCWSNILSFGCLEDLLGTSSDLQTTGIIKLSLVTGTKPSILGHSLLGCFFVLEVTHHHTWRLDLDFAIRRNALLHAFRRLTNISNTSTAGFCHVRVVEVLRHTVSFQQLQTQTAVPGQEIRWQGCTSTSSIPNMVQSQRLEQLLLDQERNDGNFQELLQLFGGHLLEHSQLELCPQTRNGQEQCWLATVEILNEGSERLCIEDVQSGDKRKAFTNPTFHAVRNWQIGEVAIILGGMSSVD
mmetsp:Transcript_8365/g.12606  ORF Transcript_8365/g.12606 Transcript_8365/m.12606 type:complete len:262 (+) Transcript_8365:373-1158(+)